MELLAELTRRRDSAVASLPALADAVRANPDDASAKAAYAEAQRVVADYRSFERGARPDTNEAGNSIAQIRGISGEGITIIPPTPEA